MRFLMFFGEFIIKIVQSKKIYNWIYKCFSHIFSLDS